MNPTASISAPADQTATSFKLPTNGNALNPVQIQQARSQIGLAPSATSNNAATSQWNTYDKLSGGNQIAQAGVGEDANIMGGLDTVKTLGDISSTNSTNDESGILSRIGTDFNNRVNQGANALEQGKDGQISPISARLQDVGAGAGFVGDIPGEAIKSAIGTIAKILPNNPDAPLSAMMGPAASALSQKLQSFQQKHPEAYGDLRAIFNIASLLPIGGAAEEGANATAKGVGKVGQVATDIGTQASQTAQKIKQVATEVGVPSNPLEHAADKIGNTIKNNVSEMKENAATRSTIAAKGPEAVKVYDETGSPEFMKSIDSTKTPEDLEAKSKMLEAAKGRLEGTAGSKLPRQVIADNYISPRIGMLQSRLGQLGKIIGAAKDDNTVVDTTDVFNHMVNEARKVGVQVEHTIDDDGKSSLTFNKLPGISGIDTARISTVKNMFDGFEPNEEGKTSNTISQLAQTRKNLSDLTSRSDAAKEVVSPGGPLDSTRRFIAQKIGGSYHQATKDYSDIARVLDQLDPDLKVRLSDESAKNIGDIKMSDYARRLLSNNAAQAKATFTSLDELAQKEASRLGKPLPRQDLADLVDFAGSLEEGLGITPRNSFFGQTSGGVRDAIEGIPTSIGGAISKVADFATKSKPNPQRTLKAMRSYTDSVISKNKHP